MSNKNVALFSLSILTSLLMSSVYAVRDGAYLGHQLGQTNTHNISRTVYMDGTGSAAATATPSSTGFGGRIFGGYNFNQYAALEVGYTKYGPTYYKTSTPGFNNTEINLQSVDLVGKGIFPFDFAGIGLNVFAKAGVAAVDVKYGGSFLVKRATAVRPIGVVGVGYDITQNFVVDVSYSRIFSHGSVLQNTDFASIGVSYHFVDKYCGQFLC